MLRGCRYTYLTLEDAVRCWADALVRMKAAATYRPLLTAFFSSAPAENLVTFFAAIFIAVPVCGFRPVRALRELTENVPNPTSVTLPPRFNVDVTLSIVEFSALPAWT